MEIWKDVVGYEGYYQVSNLGAVRSLDRVKKSGSGHHVIKGKVLKTKKETNGYLRVSLSVNGVKKLESVHRLVAKAFIPNDDSENLTINHKDCNKENNRVENLEWCKQAENNRHARENVKFKTSLKISEEELFDLYVNQKKSSRQIADMYGASHKGILGMMSRCGIESRSRSEAGKVKVKKGRK